MRNVVILKDGSKVPVPEGWDLGEVLEVLREVGHEVRKVIQQSAA